MKITKDEYLKAKSIVVEYEKQESKDKPLPRYFLDIRGGCGAVRDKWHDTYHPDYPGLHSDTSDVVEYRHGYVSDGKWNMKEEDIELLTDLCSKLNNE